MQRLYAVRENMSHTTGMSAPSSGFRSLGLSDTLIRLSPGVEGTKDLVADIVEGLEALGAVTPERETVTA